MPTAPPLPTHDDPSLEVRPATGRFDDFAAVVGPRRAGVRGCWRMAYRDSRVGVDDRPAYMRSACATEPGPGVLAYVGTVTLFERGGFERAEATTGSSGGRPRWVMRRSLR